MRILSLIVFLSVTFLGAAQLPIVFSAASNGQTINTCDGFIIDSGGQGGSGYSNGENVTITLCPDTPGEIISVVFNLFSLSTVDDNPSPAVTVDYMDVYDGSSTSAPTLGTYSGNELQGVVINATALNTSGCITLRFRSNSTGTGMFSASVTCETPCNPPTAAGIILGGEAPDSVLVCIGEDVQFTDNGSYAAFGFTLDEYLWDFMDGSSAIGQNVTHSFDQPGQYRVQLFVTDDNGCSNTNLIDLQVFVATEPDFTGFPGDTTLCLGESISFTADPESYEVLWDGFPGSQWIEDGCLPDTLLGVSQDIQIMQTGFGAGTTIDAMSDLQSICLDLEHSFMGDIVIIVECPNGQNVILHQQGGGGTQIGIPVQADNVDCSDPTTQGTPFNYCFTPTATETWVEWVDNSGFGGTIPGGDYEPVQPLSNLIGCPLNGVWTLTVIDNWAADDGTLFGFEINLDPSLYPPVTEFEPQIGWGADSSYWETPAQFMTSLSPNADVLTITPTAAGTYTYVYHVIDHFGCEHDTSVTVTVNDNVLPNAGPDMIICNGSAVQLNGTVNGVGGSTPCTYTLYLQDDFFDGWGQNTLTVTINGVPTVYSVPSGQFSQNFPLQIPNGATITLQFYDNNDFTSFDCSYTFTGPNGNVLVQGGGNFTPPNTNLNSFTADCFNGYTYSWSSPVGTFDNPNIPGPMGTFSGSGTATLTVYPTGHPLCATSDQLNVSLGGTPMVITSISPDVTICPGASTPLLATGSGGAAPYTYTWMTGSTVVGTGVPFTVTPTTTTQYCVILDGACSTATDTACVIVSHPAPIVPGFTPDKVSGCFPLPVNFTNTSTGGNVATMLVDYGDGEAELLTGMAGSAHVYAEPGVYTVTVTVTSDIGCVYSTTFTNLITVFDNPHAYFNISPNPVSMFNTDVLLTDDSYTDIAAWDWVIDGGTPGASTSENVHAHFPDGVAANYDVTLYVTDVNGCQDSVRRVVQVISDILLYAPNAFTPDGDEFNQTWFVYIDGIDRTRFNLVVYNRWGEVVWENNDPDAAWDGTYNGKLVQDGAYNWTIETKRITNDETLRFVGSFNVLK